MATARAAPRIFLGLDSSTQGLKVSAVDENLNTILTTAVNFDKDLPAFKTKGGVHDHGNAVVTTPTLMLPTALEVVMDTLKSSDFPFERVVAISGSGQQHGSVYWAKGARDTLRGLKADAPLAHQLRDAFSTPNSPIWMDSSTTKQCRQLEEAVGGAQAMADLTGSRAYERFTGNQILKIAQTSPKVFEGTERVSLISSAMCSLLLGDYAPIDNSDGAGMNLMDLRNQVWSDKITTAISPALKGMLGPQPVPGHTIVGNISQFFRDKYKFTPECRVVVWSGDNPNSLAGLGLRNPGDVGVSLGTSDTIFSIMDSADSKPGLEGHFFVNPVDPGSHMAMLCYKNGSLVREAVAKDVAAGSFDDFAKLIQSTQPGNGGNIGFFVHQPEIIPFIPVTGVRRFNAQGEPVAAFAPEVEARAVVEGQMLSMRLHKEKMGLKPKTIICTGGASQNPAITKILSDVFGVPVRAASQPDSASLGAAFRALHAVKCEEAGKFIPFAEVTANGPATQYRTVAEPDMKAHDVYTAMLPRYEALEKRVVESCQ